MLYVIAGNGTGPVREITASLKDLRDKATKEGVDFWFILEGKDEPTPTDTAIVKWLGQNEVWFEVYSAGGSTYDGAQDTLPSEGVFDSFLERIQERQADSEEVAMLVLPADPSGESDEDEELMVLVESAINADVPVYDLIGEMAQVTLDETPEAAPEPAPVKGAAKKTAAKKAAATTTKAAPTKAVAKKAAAAVQDEAETDDPGEIEPDEPVVYSAEELAKMSLAELGALAKGQGIDPKGKSKKELVQIVQEGTAPAVVEALPQPGLLSSTNGDGEVLVVIHLPGSIIVKHLTMETALGLAST